MSETETKRAPSFPWGVDAASVKRTTTEQPTNKFDQMYKSIERRARDLGVPIIEPLPEKVTPLDLTNPVVAICGLCGLELRGVMGYCCGRTNCPTGLGGPTC